MGAGRFLAVGALVALLLSACEQAPVPPKPLTEAQKALAFKAVDQARVRFSRGDCPVLSGGAELLHNCRELRAILGVWESFSLAPSNQLDESYAVFSGSAESSNGSAKLVVLVRFRDGTASVSSLRVDRGPGVYWYSTLPDAPRFQERPPHREREA